MTETYLTNWLYIALFIAAGGALVVLILLFSKLVNPQHPTPGKLAPYECGIPPLGRPWSPFAVRYFVFGLLFLVFEVTKWVRRNKEPVEATDVIDAEFTVVSKEGQS